MLNLNRKDVFKYHISEILEDSEMREEQRQTFKANVLSKASQVSINNAKEYIDSVVAEGLLEEDTAKRIFRLLDDFATRR
jgi:hypothetical protein